MKKIKIKNEYKCYQHLSNMFIKYKNKKLTLTILSIQNENLI